MRRLWLEATIVAGTFDLLSAFLFSGIKGVGPIRVLQFVASGPFGDQALGDAAFALAGIATHYLLMAIMVGLFLFAAERLSSIARQPILWGLAYGFAIWIVMYWVVRPLRWPNLPLPTAGGPVAVAQQLFSHLILVGLPIGFIVGRGVHSGRA